MSGGVNEMFTLNGAIAKSFCSSVVDLLDSGQ